MRADSPLQATSPEEALETRPPITLGEINDLYRKRSDQVGSEGADQPATKADIDRLIAAINHGWIGRGFAMGIGIWLLSWVPMVIFIVFVLPMIGSIMANR